MRWTVVWVVAALVLAVGCDGGAGAGAPTPAAPPVDASTGAPAPPQPQEPVPPADDIATVMPSSGPTPTATPSRELPHLLGAFDVDLAPEVSGIALSRLGDQPNLLWIVDDGPGTDRIHLLTLDGERFATVVMEGVEGRDTEAIAVGPCGADQPRSCVYVGDIGDNTASRDAVRVHRFAEEAWVAVGPDGEVPVETITLTHPDGPVDAESMVVDAAGRVILLTKRDGVADIHVADSFTDGVLRDAGELALPDPAEPLQSLVTGVVATDAALLPDGTALLVRTYDSLLRFTARGQDGAPTPVPGQGVEDLAGWAVEEVMVAPQVQSEAVTFFLDQHSWVTAGEGSGELWLAGGP